MGILSHTHYAYLGSLSSGSQQPIFFACLVTLIIFLIIVFFLGSKKYYGDKVWAKTIYLVVISPFVGVLSGLIIGGPVLIKLEIDMYMEIMLGLTNQNFTCQRYLFALLDKPNNLMKAHHALSAPNVHKIMEKKGGVWLRFLEQFYGHIFEWPHNA